MRPRERWLYIAAITALLLVVLLFGAVLFIPILGHLGAPNYKSSLSNVKQQALGLLMYASDYDGRLPRADRWMDASAPYIRSDAIFIDPTLLDPEAGEYGFAFFRPLSGVANEKVEQPEATPLTFQSSDLSRNANGLLDLLPYRIKTKRGNVVSFADSHAAFMPESWRFEVIVIELPE
ncbi:MAG: hypothetical protein WD716_00180 [Fimbriimonadaceae bacterium]